MLTSRVATTATRINYRRHFSTDVSFEQTHPNSRQRVSRKVIVINWRRLRIRENEKGRKKRNLKKRLVSKLLLDGREKFFWRNLNGTLRSKRNRRKKERKKFRPRYLPFTPLFRVASPGRITRYRVFSRKKEGAAPSLTIVPEDGQGSMTPKFTKPSLSSFDCEIWESLDSCIARFPTEQSSGTLGGAKLYSRTTIFYHELRFPRAFLENGCKIFWPSCYIYIFESRCT